MSHDLPELTDLPDTPQAQARQICRRCEHYFVTHDPIFRHGCRAMDFKGVRLPGLDVLETTGHLCVTCQPKD